VTYPPKHLSQKFQEHQNLLLQPTSLSSGEKKRKSRKTNTKLHVVEEVVVEDKTPDTRYGNQTGFGAAL
jgi:hypothetical protein